MNKVIKNLSYVFLANISNAISKFLFIILISKFLTNVELGQYTLALAVTAPITLLFNMKLRSYIISEDKVNYIHLKKIRNITNFIAMIIVIIVSLTFYKEFFLVFILVAVIKVLEMNSEFYQGFPNKEKFFQTPAKLMVLRTVSITLIFGVYIYETKSLILALIAQCILQFIILLFEKKINMGLVSHKKYKEQKNVKAILLTIIPLGIVQFLMSFSSSIPKYILNNFADIAIIGIFSGIIYLITIVNLFMSTLNQTLLPYIKSKYKRNKKEFNKTINVYCNALFLIISVLLVICSHVFGEYLLRVIFNEGFVKYKFLLVISSFIIFFNMSGWMYDSGLLIVKKIKYQPLFLVISMIITFVLGLFLIEKYMLFGAGYTLLIFNFLNTGFKALYFNLNNFKSSRKEGGIY
ncbi:lipopolysaccharide biosynthesis protein [Mammaliicoccus sciuri]|uniref:lipopolysaccharide biosynthesis protein n=1 Tax=Mammaliicoccus sciuri TaxID=1296 RepID=UPI00195171A3|nr:oligosaccharide flippase family protein [Mammaliicoccus sciuri]